MLRKVPFVIAIELIIGVLAFLFARERTQFGTLFIIFSSVALLILATRYGLRRLVSSQ